MRSELKIELKNISRQGWVFSFDKKSKELTEVLKPLIGDNDYQIKIQLKPSGLETYIVSGCIKTRLNLLCARCAYEFSQIIDKEFKEKIILQKKLTRRDKEIRNNHFSELMSEETFNIVDTSIFDMGEFLHELIVIEEPLRALGKKSCDDKINNCENLENIKTKINQKLKHKIHFI